MNPTASTRTPWQLPVFHIAAGILAFLIGIFALGLRPGPLVEPYLRNARTLWPLHTFTIGWISLVMLGALYQLLPVRMQIRLHSARLGWVSGALLFPGVIIMIAGLARFQPSILLPGAVLITVAFILAAYNFLRTILSSPAPQADKLFFYVALIGLAAVALLGLTLAVHLAHPLWTGADVYFYVLYAHALAGAVLWFGGIAFGVAYQLVPMFALSQEIPEARMRRVWMLLILTAAAVLLGLPAVAVLLMAVLSGYFLVDLNRLMRTRRKAMELSLIGTVVAGGWLLLGSVVALLLAFDRLGWLPGVAAAFLGLEAGIRLVVFLYLCGWLGGLILAQLYKILPFLIWVHVYGPRVGKGRVPTMQQLSKPERDQWSLYVYHLGMLATVFGWWAPALLQPGLIIMALGGLGMSLAYADLLRPLGELRKGAAAS